jgi:hypothetical protein
MNNTHGKGGNTLQIPKDINGFASDVGSPNNQHNSTGIMSNDHSRGNSNAFS